MDNQPPQPPADAGIDLEREIRQGRSFSMAEALGRMAGPGVMKGASPISLRQQAQATVAGLVKERLRDPVGVLADVLIREAQESALLLDHYDQPQRALVAFVRQVLDSEGLLAELVRETDAQWGRVFGERPYFEREGRAPHPDDPYTIASVRTALQELLAALAAAGNT